MGEYAKWAADLFSAAEELGYYIDRLDGYSITLVPMRGNRGEVRITVEARPLLGGALLREMVAPVRVDDVKVAD